MPQIESVVIVAKRKGSQEIWKPMSGIRIKTVEDAKAEIRRRSDVLDNAFDFAIRVVSLEEFSEREVVGAT